MGKHALLSASSSHRWLNCPPSARLGESYEDITSAYAAEGADAHALCEYKVKLALGLPCRDPTAELAYYNEEMESCADGYAAYIVELVAAAKQACADPVILIEQRLDFSSYVPNGFGTGDCVVVADGELQVVDYKYGQGVLVEAEGNPQMQLYALGALALFEGLYDIDTVSMSIYQPRRDNVSVYKVPKEALYQWAEEVLKPAADLAYDGNGKYQCGEWCRFCKAKSECRERADCNMKLAGYDFKRPPLLEDAEIASILGKLDALLLWASDIKEYALQAALSGKHWAGWKLCEGRSSRKYSDEIAVAQAVCEAGLDPYERKLLGVTAMSAKLGKKRFEEILGRYIERPPGKPALVPESDARPAIHTAQQDFSEA